ncbi:uncharacterized protein PV09_04726 [Verruconis gallopava]|uniref:Uncharacterized protein n=1 Tax=Verruconis gallopava TaxID=253628 RepID=A0A0D1XPI3_9PEZI|nr:uncharacterized protein PV09_04726 [Verruconis gallopava]KIW04466.1 hypothetical protein PV09_04726 [Verruconis gallopava]
MGLAVTERLVELGWNVTIVDFNAPKGEAVASRLGPQVLFVKANVANWDQLSKSFVESWQKWGRLDFATDVTCQGIGDRIDWYAPAKELPDGSPEKPDTLVADICLTSPVWCSYLGMHYFRKNAKPGGRIVFTSSQCGLYPGPSIPIYTAAKHGVVGLTRAMGARLEQLKEPITVNCICPGLVPTNIMPEAISNATPPEFVTPLSTIVRAVEGFFADEEGKYQGQVAECSGESIVMRPQNEYKDDATRYIYSDSAYAKADREQVMKELLEKRAELAQSIASVA